MAAGRILSELQLALTMHPSMWFRLPNNSQSVPLREQPPQRGPRLFTVERLFLPKRAARPATRRLTARVAAAFFTMSFPRRTRKADVPITPDVTFSGAMA